MEMKSEDLPGNWLELQKWCYKKGEYPKVCVNLQTDVR